MNYHTEAKLIDKLFQECLTIVQSKAKDYANDNDCFCNFKHIASMSKLPVWQTFMVFMCCKIARLNELLSSSKEPNNESIEDSLKDLINYAALLSVWLKVQDNEKY